MSTHQIGSGVINRAAQTAQQVLASSEQVDYATATDIDMCRVIGSLQASIQILLLAVRTEVAFQKGQGQ